MFAKGIAQQLHAPSGIIGRQILPRLFNRRNAALNDLTLQCLALQSHDQVLEVGFGGGYLLNRMASLVPKGRLAGVDISPEMVAFCHQRYRSLIEKGKLDVKCSGAEDLPYPTESFTKACTVNTIFYWGDAPQAISELWRVLTDEGMLVICFTLKKYLKEKAFAQHGVALYEPDDVRRLMEAGGFQDVRIIQGADKYREFVCAVGRRSLLEKEEN